MNKSKDIVEQISVRRRNLSGRYHDLIRRMDEVIAELYMPERYTVSEYETLVDKYRALEVEYCHLENDLKAEYNTKCMKYIIKQLTN